MGANDRRLKAKPTAQNAMNSLPNSGASVLTRPWPLDTVSQQARRAVRVTGGDW